MYSSRLAVAHAKIRHRRYMPKAHDFDMSLDYLWFDPDSIEQHIDECRWWSKQGFNFLTVDENDFINMERGTIRQKIARLLIQEQHFTLPYNASIRILALPRTLGFRFNSVVFYFVFDQHDQALFVLSEITNTPWNERKVYIHDCQKNQTHYFPYASYQFNFKKDFHVSPFMPMSIDYRWRFSFSKNQTIVHMQLFDKNILQFDATMRFELEAITDPSQQTQYAIAQVFEPFKMVSGIYLNAFRLWLKKIPFYRHPKKSEGKL